MLRSEYYRALADQNARAEAEKTALRERIARLQADLGREEGRRIQLDNEWERLKVRTSDAEKSAAKIGEEAEQSARESRRELEALLVSIERLEAELEARQERESASVILTDDIRFPSGSTELTSEMMEKIRNLRSEITTASHISIVGYTDDQSVTGSRFVSNWALAAARAAAVLEYIRDGLDMTAPEYSVVSRGPQEPKVPNTSPENRRINRRVEIIAVYR